MTSSPQPASRSTISSLAGRLAIVSGASRGIGLAVARSLVEAGVRVVMLARGTADLEARAHELGSAAHAVPCDVGEESDVERVAASVRERFGEAPDIIVNNAGLFRLAPVAKTSAADFTAALDVNLVAPFRIVRAFLPAMRARGVGDIVAIGSIADHMPFPDNGAYAASKYGVRALHEVLRAELRGSGLRVTVVSPGPVDTALWDPIGPDDRPGFTPRRLMLPPAAVAAAVCFAVSQPPEVDIDLIRLSRS